MLYVAYFCYFWYYKIPTSYVDLWLIRTTFLILYRVNDRQFHRTINLAQHIQLAQICVCVCGVLYDALRTALSKITRSIYIHFCHAFTVFYYVCSIYGSPNYYHKNEYGQVSSSQCPIKQNIEI